MSVPSDSFDPTVRSREIAAAATGPAQIPAVPSIALSDGHSIPALGFGVWRIDDAGAEGAVGQALDVGYRLVDTARLYENEPGVGRAVRAAAGHGITREDICVTSKVWNSDHGYDATRRAFDASMDRLGLDALDLYLIHWPQPARNKYVETWKALIDLRNDGRVRSIGVSNFQPEHLERIAGETGEMPVVNQVELHPFLQQKTLRAYHGEHGILTQAWRPIGGGKGLLDDPTIREVAGRAGVSPAQAVLAWHLAMGVVPVPKSVHRNRMVENLLSVSVELPAEDRGIINALDREERYGPHPDA